MKKFFLFLILITLPQLLPLNADITLTVQPYPNPRDNPVTQAQKDLVKQAIFRLAEDPRLANHPIRRYLYDPHLLARIIFDNPRLANSNANGFTNKNEIIIKSYLPTYLGLLIHEFIHIDTTNYYACSGRGYAQ